MAYTDIDDPSAYFNTKLYTGNSGTNAQTGVGFQPDWTWIKGRSTAYSHNIYDSVRGVTKIIKSNSTGAEDTQSTSLTAFGTDGFTLGSYDESNYNNATYASWNWKAGTSFTNDASGTSIGSIDSAGSVNQDAGFSIVSFTSTGSTSTVAHGLGVKPDLYIIKKRAGDGGWFTFFTIVDGSLDYLLLHNTNAKVDVSLSAPTSTVFSTDNGSSGETMICYAFASKQGYSKFGSYKGNGNADGTFVYTGFKPAWLLIKQTGAVGKWLMIDNKRDPHNACNHRLNADVSNAENTNGIFVDMLSNGWKFRTTDDDYNTSGVSGIYMAFAEQPFVTSTGVPATAR